MHNHIHSFDKELPEFEKVAQECGFVKIVFQGIEWPGSNFSQNETIMKCIERRPDLITGFGGINLFEETDPDIVDQLRDQGFAGLKFITPEEPYHSERYYPYYERAEKLGVPCLFHLGIVSPASIVNLRVDCNHMRPIYLDTIARDFKDLTIIGAHLGNPWYEEATMSMRWNPNLYLDITGSTLKKKKPSFIGDLLWWSDTTDYTSPKWSSPWEQIVFGTDVPPARCAGLVEDYENLMDTLGVSEELQNKVFFETAAGMLRKVGVDV